MDKEKTVIAAGGANGVSMGVLAAMASVDKSYNAKVGDIKGSWISSSSTCECYKCKAKTPLRKCELGYICEGCYKENIKNRKADK